MSEKMLIGKVSFGKAVYGTDDGVPSATATYSKTISALRSENEKLKTDKRELVEAMEKCLPIVVIDAQAHHLLDGFRKQRRPQDDFIDELQAAVAKHREG